MALGTLKRAIVKMKVEGQNHLPRNTIPVIANKKERKCKMELEIPLLPDVRI